MKKMFAAVAALVLGAGSTFALDLEPGIRGNLALNVGSEADDDMGADDLDNKLLVGGGLALYANLGFKDVNNWAFGVQPELGFQFNNGYKGEESGYTLSLTDTTFEFPVLVTARYTINEKFFVGAGIGPYLSIPLGKIKMKYEDDDGSSSEKYSSSGLNTGIAFDLNGGMALGPGALVLDMRYLLDFGPTKVKFDGSSYKAFTRRALTFGVGYQLKFSF